MSVERRRPSDAAAGRRAAVGASGPGAWLPHPDRRSWHGPRSGRRRASRAVQVGAVDVRQSFSDGQRRDLGPGERSVLSRLAGASSPHAPSRTAMRWYGCPTCPACGRTSVTRKSAAPIGAATCWCRTCWPTTATRSSIADGDVPVDRSLDASRMVIAPPFRGGAVVKFAAPRQWRVTGTVVATGEPGRLAASRHSGSAPRQRRGGDRSRASWAWTASSTSRGRRLASIAAKWTSGEHLPPDAGRARVRGARAPARRGRLRAAQVRPNDRRAAAVLAAVLVVLGSARAEAACTLSATPIAFGTYNVFQAGPDDSTGTITYRCGTRSQHPHFDLGWPSGTFTNRTLRTGVETLRLQPVLWRVHPGLG